MTGGTTNPYEAPSTADTLRTAWGLGGTPVKSPLMLGCLAVLFVIMRCIFYDLEILASRGVVNLPPVLAERGNAGTMILAGIAGMAWIYRCAKNAQQVEPRTLYPGPISGALSFLIPIVNLVVPYLTMRSIAVISYRNSPARRPPSGLLLPWWLFWLASGAVSLVARYGGNPRLMLVHAALYQCAGILFCILIVRISRAQLGMRIPERAVPVASGSRLQQVLQPRTDRSGLPRHRRQKQTTGH